MAKKNIEISVEEKLRTLYDLQYIDSRLDEIRSTRGELPIEVEDLENEIEGLNKRISKLETDIEDFNKEINTKKEVINHSQTLIEKYKTQQDNVKNNKEFEALSKEMEFQELEIQLAEKKIREFEAKISQKNEILILLISLYFRSELRFYEKFLLQILLFSSEPIVFLILETQFLLIMLQIPCCFLHYPAVLCIYLSMSANDWQPLSCC